MTRVQKERFFNEEDYVRMKDFYILDKEKMELAKQDMYILHPLPRVNEISVEVDDDPRAAYFKQAQYGVYVRMALILTLLEVEMEHMLNSQARLSMKALYWTISKPERAWTSIKYLNLDKLDCYVAIIKNATQQQDGQKGYHQDRVPH